MEHLIQKAFEKLMQGKTVIIIAHRLSTVRNADHIIVMDNGRVAEEGSHDALLQKGGRYASMWKPTMKQPVGQWKRRCRQWVRKINRSGCADADRQRLRD